MTILVDSRASKEIIVVEEGDHSVYSESSHTKNFRILTDKFTILFLYFHKYVLDSIYMWIP